MQERLKQNKVDVGDSQSQIIPVMIKDDVKIFSIAQDLMSEGVFLNPICYPAVKRHKSRFRISISSVHDQDTLKKGADIIVSVLKKHEVI